MPTRDKLPEFAAFLAQHRRGSEPLWEIAKRMLIVRALAETKTQKDAARVLGCSTRVMCYYAKERGLMPPRTNQRLSCGQYKKE